MSLFSFLHRKTETIMVFHDHALQLVQFEYSKNEFRLIGFNELSLTDGLLEKGTIVNMDAFKDVLFGLFSQAQPNAIKTKELAVTIPQNLLYSFVQDFDHYSDEMVLKDSILESVRGHFPLLVEDLVLDYASKKKGNHVSYAVYASPKKWQKRFIKVCRAVGVSSVEFIPEPVCQMGLREDDASDDVALFSYHKGCVHLSLFHNGLLHDSYLVFESTENLKMDFLECHSEFRVAQQDFLARFNKPLQAILFVGFEKDHKVMVRKLFDSVSEPLIFLEPKSSKLGEAIPFEPNMASLFGLFNTVFSRSDE